MESFDEHMRYYRQQHNTVGCKITHMFGVPLIAISFPVALVNWKVALGMFGVGWTLQFIGHYVFQKNKPVFLENPLNPWTYISALVFVSEEWAKVLTGKSLGDASEPTSAAKL